MPLEGHQSAAPFGYSFQVTKKETLARLIRQLRIRKYTARRISSIGTP